MLCKVTIAKTETTLQVSKLTLRHACLGGTSVQILHILQVFMSEAGHEPESFPDRIFFASMFNDISDRSKTVQRKCLGSGKK